MIHFAILTYTRLLFHSLRGVQIKNNLSRLFSCPTVLYSTTKYKYIMKNKWNCEIAPVDAGSPSRGTRTERTGKYGEGGYGQEVDRSSHLVYPYLTIPHTDTYGALTYLRNVFFCFFCFLIIVAGWNRHSRSLITSPRARLFNQQCNRK